MNSKSSLCALGTIALLGSAYFLYKKFYAAPSAPPPTIFTFEINHQDPQFQIIHKNLQVWALQYKSLLFHTNPFVAESAKEAMEICEVLTKLPRVYQNFERGIVAVDAKGKMLSFVVLNQTPFAIHGGWLVTRPENQISLEGVKKVRGAATCLLLHMLPEVDSQVPIYVTSMRKAEPFYEKLGFQATGKDVEGYTEYKALSSEINQKIKERYRKMHKRLDRAVPVLADTVPIRSSL